MKKLFLIIVAILLLFSSAHADVDELEGIAIDDSSTIENISGPSEIEGQTIATSCALGDNYQPTAASTFTAARYTNKDWAGAGYKDTSTTHCICKLVFKLTAGGTGLSGMTFYAKIGTIDANDDIDSILTNGTSADVPGNDSWSGSEVAFNFSPCVTVTANPTYGYALIVGRKITSEQSGWLEVHYESTGAWSEGTGISRWDDDAGLPWPDPDDEFNATADLWIEIYEE